MITVYADAPEENKETAEPQTCEGDRRRLYFRAVGELAVAQILWRDFRQGRIFSRLPLTSELDALFAENANSHLATQDKFES